MLETKKLKLMRLNIRSGLREKLRILSMARSSRLAAFHLVLPDMTGSAIVG